jgi:glycosyltransferase involved in cell wall biosynthesis
MRIALCLEYPIDQQGGTEVLVSELIKGLSREHRIILVSPNDAASLARSRVAPFVTQHISFTPVWNSSSNASTLAEKIALAKPDLAHFHFGGAYGWGNRYPFRCPIYFLHRRNIPCFSTVHLAVSILDGYCGPQKPAWFKLLMLPLAWSGKLQQLQCVRREITVSQHDFRKLRRWYWPLRNRFTQIYHSRLKEAPPAADQPRTPVILNVGHIAQRKGQAVLAEAFAQIAPRHPEWNLQLAGSYTDEAAVPIRRLIKEHRLEQRIFLLGERLDAFDLMQRATLYVQPSFWEALGLALQEAMFAGCACIGSRAGGIPELIQHGQNGLLFEPGNVAQLAQMLEQLIADQGRREQLGRSATTSIRARGMTADQMIKRHLELYDTAYRR